MIQTYPITIQQFILSKNSVDKRLITISFEYNNDLAPYGTGTSTVLCKKVGTFTKKIFLSFNQRRKVVTVLLELYSTVPALYRTINSHYRMFHNIIIHILYIFFNIICKSIT